MPGEIIGEAFSGIFRLIFRILVEVVLEILIKGLGYLFYRPFNKKARPDDFKVVAIGLFLWGIIVFGAFELMNFIMLDNCLDTGGSYNHQLDICEK